jgi:transposase-like protein
MAMQHAINANLLRTWITKAQDTIAKQMAPLKDTTQVE